jgi:hypothetical protein
MADDVSPLDEVVPTTGRWLMLPAGPIFHLQRAGESAHEIGAFRSWAGYKELGSDAATDGLILFQHVLSFGPTEASGRTGIHCHLAHVHIVIPTSGRGVFSYDGVVTEAAPGMVIVQHGGTVHDQFSYSYAAASAEENRNTPITVDPEPPGSAPRSFGFLEFFVPRTIADVEIVPPGRVTSADQASAWDHPYHPPGARFALQAADDPGAAWRPVAGRPQLEVRNAGTWEPTGRLVATQILRRAARPPDDPQAEALGVPGETGGIEVLYLVSGAAELDGRGGTRVRLEPGDCLTCTAGLAGAPTPLTPDFKALRFFVSSRAEQLREHSAEEIAVLEALGPAIVRRREIRHPGDARPVNFLHESA